MSQSFGSIVVKSCAQATLWVFAFALPFVSALPASAQILTPQRSVAGVWIDTEGAVSSAEVDQTKKLRELMQKALGEGSGELNQFTPVRKVSLRKLEEAIIAHQDKKAPLPAEM